MTFEQIRERIFWYKRQGLRIFCTSSFQTQSVVLLHIISRIDKLIPVYFLNTGYHFPETLEYKKQLQELFELEVIDLYPVVPRFQQKDENGRLLYTSDPDFCCYLNKVAPLEPILANYDVWISGIRAGQSEVRSKMQREVIAQYGVTRFHPLLHWTNKMVVDYINQHKLPRHPLEPEGYLSIGCEPCTRKIDPELLEDPRLARWFGLNKTECGLHTELVKNPES